jgi:hypothetical protein
MRPARLNHVFIYRHFVETLVDLEQRDGAISPKDAFRRDLPKRHLFFQRINIDVVNRIEAGPWVCPFFWELLCR